MFYENFIRLCNSIEKAPSAVVQEMGMNKSMVTGWKKRGSLPNDATAQKLADYFGITVSELMAENEEKPIQMDGLTEEAAIFAEKFRKASPEIQMVIKTILNSAENK